MLLQEKNYKRFRSSKEEQARLYRAGGHTSLQLWEDKQAYLPKYETASLLGPRYVIRPSASSMILENIVSTFQHKLTCSISRSSLKIL